MGSFIKKVTNALVGDSGAKGAQEEANRIAAESAEQQRQTDANRAAQEKAQRDMQANFAADLGGENKATVIAGGTADAIGADPADLARKRKTGSGLASSLGINV